MTDLLNSSFRIGRLFNINIRVHFLFVVYIAWELLRSGKHMAANGAFLAMLFGIVLVHEFGHCLGARTVRGDARDILMWPLGGLAMARAPMRPWPQFVTVACGPLVNVVFCLISGTILVAYTGLWELVLLNPFGGLYILGAGSWIEYLWIFYQVNWMLLCFNLLPIFPMDGGQLLRTFIWPFLGLQQATIVAAGLGLVGAGGFVLWALAGGGGSMLLFMAIFGAFTCWQQLQAARYGALQEDSPYEAYYGPSHDPRPWWKRILGIRGGRARPAAPRPTANPNPGGWERVQEAREREEAELDRILRKVSEHGMQSLTYVERQTLERITRERQEREREYSRQTRL